ncbi:Acyl-CoA dehydrogenase-related isoform 1 [Dorcoceras hygrometricum]|uniref:Acyl-CoA dehydrogenase-related isoform 1 n=1 Tax=Dorcoceras hygrometricum TaxID=472368 RepID=A0A2Z7AJY7_9LAMI|nr:Acyl-CoA dehydrogenase-related isoform 1 [Dorcoceras hygrometricum]
MQIDSDLVIYRTTLLRTFQVSTRSVLGKCVYLVILAMSLFDLQDVCIAIGSIATLDLPMVVDLIGIYGLKGPYCTLTTTDWFLQALSAIPRGSWGDVARRFTMIRWAAQYTPPSLSHAAAAAVFAGKLVSGQLDVENPFVLISSGLLVQPDEGVSDLVADPDPQHKMQSKSLIHKTIRLDTKTCSSNRSTQSNTTSWDHRLTPAGTQTTQKQENKYEVKPHYEELSKHLNMQHAINQCYECMRAIKDLIARLASRLAVISVEPLYHAQQVSRWKSSVRDLQGPSAHHSSVVFRHDKSVGHHSDDSVGLFRHNKSVGQSQRGSQSGHQSICQAQYISRKSLPKSRNQLKNYRVPLDREFEQLRDPLQGRSTASTGYQSKEQVSGIPAPPKSLKSSAENGGNLRKICSGEQ